MKTALIIGFVALVAGCATTHVEQKSLDHWTIGNDRVERKISFTDGKLRTESFRDLATGRELIAENSTSDELAFRQGDQAITGASDGWSLVGTLEKKLPHGERQLDITLRRGDLQATKTYIVYPDSTVIREWVTFANVGTSTCHVDEPGFLHTTLAVGKSTDSLDFDWMTGGENNPGSWMLRTEQLTPGKTRKFDSYDPFPAPAGAPILLGDGIDARIELNDKPIWPTTQPWQYVRDSSVQAPVDLTTKVAAGDRLIFRVNMHGNFGWDTTQFDPTITYADGETHIASKEFTGEQGKNGWRYQYIEGGKFVDLVFYSEHNQWRKAKDNPTGTPFVGVAAQHPDANQDAVRVWTAPKAGQIHVTSSICNIGNVAGTGGGGFKPGTASYAPWYALYDRKTRAGIFVGWDYFGHWASSFQPADDGSVGIDLRVAGHHQTLAPGESFSTPQSFVGLFRDDLDNAGNELLDWQYAYAWDYTRDGTGGTYPWFPALRTLGFWMKGTGWGKDGVGWLGGDPDLVSTFRKVFRTADYMRYTGVDVYHRDWGWWDVAGDWKGPDFRATNQYLHKSGMGELIYAFLYTVSQDSKVGKAHPDWLNGTTLDMSNPAVVDFIEGQLDEFVKRWGDFEWRNDSIFTQPRNGDDTPMLGQDQGFRQILRHFLEKHPGSAFQAVNGGGNYGGVDYTSYASTFSFSDGGVGPIRNYYASLLFPPDKTSDIPDIYNPDQYDKATWRGLLCINYDTTGDTWNVDKLEGIRQLNDIYHYLLSRGVVGRWVHVFRPNVDGDDPTMYFQRLSGDGKRGIIIPKHTAPGPITIRPKGLALMQSYDVTYQESDATETRLGAELMSDGITIQKMQPGELIYLNLPLHPGSKLDQRSPEPPSSVHATRAENMGYPGVELIWKPGSDDNWVSYYEIFRDSKSIDKVAKGTYYFDHSAGADLGAKYEVRTVDGAGNYSAKAASTATKVRAMVIDDAATDGVTFTGNWQHETNLQPAHAGTISSSDEKGATFETKVRGKRVLIFSKLGAACGLATISIDNGPEETIDTYDADDIWGVAVYQKILADHKDHTVRVTVSGQKNPRSSKNTIYIDGIRGEPN